MNAKARKPIMCATCKRTKATKRIGSAYVCQQCWTDWKKTHPSN